VRERQAHLDVLERRLHVGAEARVLELPSLFEVRVKGQLSSSRRSNSATARTHVLAVRATSLLGVLDLVEVVLVELTNERGKVGMLEVEREDRASERVHVLFRK